ncbi:MAG: class I SAM-dependent methyltransferase [Anaerolineales bacterium]|nr:class I SAM-dependent methyltransferase [Anaerolineales bacterium]
MAKVDIRTAAARFYDYNPNAPNDIPFYLERIPSQEAAVLELGCGTGRVTLALSRECGYIHGIDLSEAMVAICREKLRIAKIGREIARVEVGDISDFELGRRFDLIIAPFRVMQNLETDEEVEEMLGCIRRHLSPGGTAILNVFRPHSPWEVLTEKWVSVEETLSWKVAVEGGKVTCSDRRPRLDAEQMTLYPELIYRRYKGEVVVEEAVLKILMRCYYAEQFTDLIAKQGFRIVERWGGYAGEVYGEGPELVVQFGL